jgi:hypothetical protein
MSARPMLGMWMVAVMSSVILTPASADHWRGGREGGEWKDEYRDGPCKVKIESKDDQMPRPRRQLASWRVERRVPGGWLQGQDRSQAG